MEYLLAGLFLPLFPLTAGFNALFTRIRDYRLRMLLMLAWPAAGVSLVMLLGGNPPGWLVYWAAFTALLYAFRSLVIRELGLWTAYMATSCWALLWLVFPQHTGGAIPWLMALTLLLPLVLIPWLTEWLKERFGGAYAGTVNGLAINLPRISSLLVFTLLAAIATPLFPGFFVLLGMVNSLLPVIPLVALGVLLVWLLWTWSGVRILQGFIVGPRRDQGENDINLAVLSLFLLSLLAYIVIGLSLSGEVL